MTSPTDAPSPPRSQPGKPWPENGHEDDMPNFIAAALSVRAMEAERDRYAAAIDEVLALPAAIDLAEAHAILWKARAGVR